MAGYAQVLARLEEQELATERLLARHRESVERLLAEHRRTLAEGRRVLEAAASAPDCRGPLGSPCTTPLSSKSFRDPSFDEPRRPLLNADQPDPAPPKAAPPAEGELVTPHNWVQRALLPVTESELFQAVVMLFVVLSAVLLAMGVDMNMRKILTGDASPWQTHVHAAQNVIFVVFCVEIVLRVLAEQCDFLCGPRWRWNVFEAALVGTNLFDTLAAHNAGGMSALRLVRILRIFRAVRIMRLFGFFRQLRLMIFSVIASLVSLSWALGLMGILLFVAAIYLEETGYHYLVGLSAGEAEDDPIADLLRNYWGGMYRAMYSLIFSVSGGKDWGDLAQAFIMMSWVDGVAYTLIVLFVIFGFYNVVIGIFVSETGDLAELDHDLVLQNAARKMEALKDSIRKLFAAIDTDGNGVLTCEEISNALKSNSTISTDLSLLSIDVPPNKADLFCALLDCNLDGTVSSEEFVSTCLRLQGSTKPLDTAMVIMQQDKMQLTMDAIIRAVSQPHAAAPSEHEKAFPSMPALHENASSWMSPIPIGGSSARNASATLGRSANKIPNSSSRSLAISSTSW